MAHRGRAIGILAAPASTAVGVLCCAALVSADASRAEVKPAAHWAYQPLVKPPLPAVVADAAAANPIDRFILAELSARGMHPSPPADRRTLIPRVYFDLT